MEESIFIKWHHNTIGFQPSCILSPARPRHTRIPPGWVGVGPSDCQSHHHASSHQRSQGKHISCLGEGRMFAGTIRIQPSCIPPQARPRHTRIPPGWGASDCWNHSAPAVVHPPTSEAGIHMHPQSIIAGATFRCICNHSRINLGSSGVSFGRNLSFKGEPAIA